MIIKIIIGILLVAAALILMLATSLPLAVRLFAAATDIAIGGVLWIVLRQKFPKR
jgi:hypothetical protein